MIENEAQQVKSQHREAGASGLGFWKNNLWTSLGVGRMLLPFMPKYPSEDCSDDVCGSGQ